MDAFKRWWRRARGGSVAAAPVAGMVSEADFASIFANAAIGIAISDHTGRLTRTNAAMDRFLGYEPGELAGKLVSDLTHPDDHYVGLEMQERLKRGESDSYRIEKRYRRKDGTVVWGRLVASAIRDADGKWLYGLGMIEDITEQQRIKEQLDASRAQLEEVNRRLKLYLERAPLACIVGDARNIVQAWNPAAEAMFGYSAAEALGRDIYELIATPEGIAAIAQLKRGREMSEGIVLLNRRKDGTRLHCHWYFTVVANQTDGSNGVIAFAFDATARIRSEEERRLLEINLRQAQKMQSLGTLAGGIAHDFNNILLAISGNTKLAMQDLPPEHPVQISLAEIDKASTRATSVVNQILTFSRREELPQHPVNLRTVIEESLNLMRATLSTRIEVRSSITAGAPIVLADPAQIHQVLINLATNAAHAMGDGGGTLSVGLQQINVDDAAAQHVAELKPGTYQRITMSDTGVGMSSQVMERIFEPFFTTKPHGQGTGLGLAVVHGIVKSHGGAIAVQSAPGKGATFSIYLPAMPAEARVTPTATPAERGRGQSILYVDDEEPLVYLITRVLDRMGYRVTGFVDVRVALETFKMNPTAFDAVVTDLSMPGMPGTEFARQVLQIRPELPVVMTSGYVRTEDREQALQIGVRELLLKPNTVEGLGEVLHRLLSSN